MWARGFYRDHVLANAKYRAYSHFCWPCLESRTHTRMTQSVISDRLVRIQARDGQVIRKHIWPGSGNVGREHLLREWQMHNLVYQNFNLSSRRLVTTPLSKAADSSWFEQEDFSQSRSLWAVAQTDFDELAEVLDDLESNHSGIRARILDDTGALRRFVNVYVGNDDVRFLEGLGTPTPDGTQISIIPAVAGG